MDKLSQVYYNNNNYSFFDHLAANAVLSKIQ